jgi:hypothetical protein
LARANRAAAAGDQLEGSSGPLGVRPGWSAFGQVAHLQVGEQVASGLHRHAGPQWQAGAHAQDIRCSLEDSPAAVEFEARLLTEQFM